MIAYNSFFCSFALTVWANQFQQLATYTHIIDYYLDKLLEALLSLYWFR